MYERLPDSDEPDAFGLKRSDYAHEVIEVWPENWPVFELFCALRTQWRVGAMGPVGLDYNTLFHKLDRMRLEPSEYEVFEDDIRAMEHAALEAMSAKD